MSPSARVVPPIAEPAGTIPAQAGGGSAGSTGSSTGGDSAPGEDNAGAVSRETAPAAPLFDRTKLPHDWISSILTEASNVAGMLRSSGATAAAAALELGISHAWEAGKLLKLGGK